MRALTAACAYIFVTLCFIVQANASDDAEAGDVETDDLSDRVLIRFGPKNAEQMSIVSRVILEITENEHDYWNPPNNLLKPVDVMVREDHWNEMKTLPQLNNVSFSVLHENVQRLIDEYSMSYTQSRIYTSDVDLDDFFNSFQSYSSIKHFIEKLSKEYPSLVTTSTVGTSFEGRDLDIIRISSGPKNYHRTDHNESVAKYGKLIIFIDAGMHGREWMAPATALHMAYSLAKDYRTNNKTRDLVNKFNFIILPLMNPDGYEYSRTHGRLWKKTRNKNMKSKCMGVDLNRNFDHHWLELKGASDDPCNNSFAGSHPFDQPESRALARFVWRKRKRIRAYISLHSYGNSMIYPWGYKVGGTADADPLREAAEIMVQSINAASREDGQPGPSVYEASSFDVIAGTITDWTYGTAGILYSFTYGLRPGTMGFFVEPSQIVQSGNETLAGILELADFLIEIDELGGDDTVEPDIIPRMRNIARELNRQRASDAQ